MSILIAADETVSVRISAPTISEARELLFRAAAALVALDCDAFAGAPGARKHSDAAAPANADPARSLAEILDEVTQQLASVINESLAEDAISKHSDAATEQPSTPASEEDEPPTRAEMLAEVNTIGSKLFGRREWPAASPWLVAAWTRRHTPTNQRIQAAELDAEELSSILVGLVNHGEQTLAEYRKSKAAAGGPTGAGAPGAREANQAPQHPQGTSRRATSNPAAPGNVVMAPARNAAATG